MPGMRLPASTRVVEIQIAATHKRVGVAVAERYAAPRPEVWDADALERRAACKRKRPYRPDWRRDAHWCHRAAAVESPVADGRDRIIDAVDRDRCRDVGGGYGAVAVIAGQSGGQSFAVYVIDEVVDGDSCGE